MLSGALYDASDPELVAGRKRARRLARLYNATTEEEPEERERLLREMFGRLGARPDVEPPFHIDYGSNIFAGDKLYMNFGCIVLDCAEVTIGHNVFFAPRVQLLTATHPVEAAERIKGPELARPIHIGDNVWLGAGVIVCPGVSIGNDTTIGAGSVVVRDVPAGVVAAGNPCRVLRAIEAVPSRR